MGLSAQEIAALWHFPHEGFAADEIVWIPSGQVRVPSVVVENKEGVLLGDNVFGGRQAPVRMLDKDRVTHVNIVGKTGVGKSTFMHNLIHQDIKDGKGVGVVDPHGKLVSDILQWSIPEYRLDDVVVIDIANEKNPPPLNPMLVPGKKDHLASGQVVSVLDKIYDINAPRVSDTMNAALVTLWQEETSTVRDVAKLFTDIEYRNRFLDRVTNPVVLDFWDEFRELSPSVQRDLSYPVLHRMRKFYGNPTLYPMMCHPSAFDFADFIRNKKIILISLGIDERKVPEKERQLLGAVLVSQLQMAAMSSLERTTPFFLYIDEVQNFVTTSLDKVLSEARKFKFHLTIANQFLGQLKGNILESVMGNIGASVVFQVGLNDAKLLAPYFHPEFSNEDLVNLSPYNTAVNMRFDEKTLPAFSLQTRTPPGYGSSDEEIERSREREQNIRQRSVERYTPKTRDDVLEWLARRYPRPKSDQRQKGVDDQGPEGWVVSEE